LTKAIVTAGLRQARSPPNGEKLEVERSEQRLMPSALQPGGGAPGRFACGGESTSAAV
jgi:hypothetical protein